jgi:hypothetical protein
VLWGRLWVDEESPEGAWTPLAGVEVVVYPYAPAVMAELERIRETARDSGRQYETTVARFQDVLRGYARQLDPAQPPSPPGARSDPAPSRPRPGAAVAGEERGQVRRRVTDPAGIFVFEGLPAGEWLAVAVRLSPYSAGRARREELRPSRGRERFSGSEVSAPAQEAEIWLERVRVGPGDRARLFWSDRARWLVGPVR